MDDRVKSLLLVGVGGQGIIRASDILTLALMKEGYDAKKSEVHGMAQRGGCVSSYVRFGAKVYSPLAGRGDVDILVAFEKMESLRYLDYLREGGRVIVNDLEIFPPAVNLGEALYPEKVIPTIAKRFPDVCLVSATAIAEHAGDARMANTILLGILSRYLPVSRDIWHDVLGRSFAGALAEKNINVFE
ncbi:MAG: indolepyruvate oxidoreductase subunit beta, partial [Deltaproteobacteria bacterium]|nr:indolepyruvate oxidoreductase subunit beta [Deltaproteobacteria bacterium]